MSLKNTFFSTGSAKVKNKTFTETSAAVFEAKGSSQEAWIGRREYL